MIALQSLMACAHCPISLICLGDHWHIDQRLHLRRCHRCNTVYFTIGHETYLCSYLPRGRPGQVWGFTSGCEHSTAPDCFTHHRDDFSAIF